MDDEVLKHYKKAGRVAQAALQHAVSLIEPGASMRDILDSTERFIHDKGCKPAFPAQSCVNEIAAHYCPTDKDDHIFTDTDLVKVDVGVHSNGYIGDNATTVSLDGSHEALIQAVKDAVEAAESMLKAGVTPFELGKTIHEAMRKHDVQPVRNLTGHGLGRYEVHVKPSIPNYAAGSDTSLEAGQVIAIEPFATDGTAGMIYNASDPTVFMLVQKRPVRSLHARRTLQAIELFDGLPFTTRWLTRALGNQALRGLRELEKAGIIESYPPLPEKSEGLVAQHEHTFLVLEDGCQRLTS